MPKSWVTSSPVTKKDEIQRVWLLVGVALAALFLLRTAGMVFQGALTGVGMYVAAMVAFSTFPPLKKLLFSFGGLSDTIVSFGLPALLASVLGISERSVYRMIKRYNLTSE